DLAAALAAVGVVPRPAWPSTAASLTSLLLLVPSPRPMGVRDTFALGAPFERPLQLIEVVVVVPGDEGGEMVEVEAAAHGVDAAAVPVRGRQLAHEGEGLLAPR